jgi:hypothetical protein
VLNPRAPLLLIRPFTDPCGVAPLSADVMVGPGRSVAAGEVPVQLAACNRKLGLQRDTQARGGAVVHAVVVQVLSVDDHVQVAEV